MIIIVCMWVSCNSMYALTKQSHKLNFNTDPDK